MLNTYLTATQNLLQLPAAPASLYTTAFLTTCINTARGQLAGDGECIRTIGTISTVVGQRPYNFASLSIGVASSTGRQGVIHVRRISYNLGQGTRWIPPKAWEWFDLYELNNPVPVNGPPRVWSQYAQGSAPQPNAQGQGGSFYISPPPDSVYTLNCDCVCYPQALATDNDVEAIPYLWTDAVPFLAAYYALLSAQTSARMADAQKYFEIYDKYVQRARRAANPSPNRYLYEQSSDVVQPNKVGLQKSQGGG